MACRKVCKVELHDAASFRANPRLSLALEAR